MQLVERPDDRHVGRAAGNGAAGARDEDGAHAEAARSFDVVDEAVADHDGLGGLGFHRAQRRLEDARVRLQIAVLVRGQRDGEESLEREVGLERVQAAVRIRNQSDLQAGGVQRPEHAGNVVVHREMVAGGPFGVDVACRGFDPGPGASHAFDDPPRVVDVNLRVVVVDVAARIEHGGSRGDGAIEGAGIDRDAVARAEVTVPATLERGAGVNQGEIDIEEDGTGRGLDGRRGHGSASSGGATGPATTTAARSGSSTSDAADRISSIVTASRSAGRRRS